MMFIIGGLYGFLGGGLFGLGLQESSLDKKFAWHQLLVEMCAGGIIFYYFVLGQLGILMTPPRSEALAICAGLAIARYPIIPKKALSLLAGILGFLLLLSAVAISRHDGLPGAKGRFGLPVE